MKKFEIVVAILFAVSGLISAEEIELEECFKSTTEQAFGERSPGDWLLFRDIKSLNWAVATNHTVIFEYRNTNITRFEVGFAPRWRSFGFPVNWNPNFRFDAFVDNSTNFEVVLTVYGFHAENMLARSIGESKERNVTTIYDSKNIN